MQNRLLAAVQDEVKSDETVSIVEKRVMLCSWVMLQILFTQVFAYRKLPRDMRQRIAEYFSH